MLNTVKRTALAAALIVTGVMTTSASAEARDRHHNRGDNTAIAIGAGLLGLALGAALADQDDRYYDDRSWHPRRRYVTVHDQPGYFYYYADAPRQYYRDRYYDRHYGNAYSNTRRDRYERRHYSRWEQGQRQVDRWYGERNYDRNGYRRNYRHHRGH